MQALFLTLYKSFANVLTEPLREAFKEGLSQPSEPADEMAIDLASSTSMEVDKENGRQKKRCHLNFLLCGSKKFGPLILLLLLSLPVHLQLCH